MRLLEIPRNTAQFVGFQWAPDGRALLYVDTLNRVSNIWRQPIDDGAPEQLTNFESEEIFYFVARHDEVEYLFGFKIG